MASKDRDKFVEDGGERIRNDEQKRIGAEVAARYARELAEAGYFRRLCIRWQMRREVLAELKRAEPSHETLYGVCARPCHPGETTLPFRAT